MLKTNRSMIENTPDDDWDTDPDFINNVTEQEQRWGSKTIVGSGRTAGAIDMDKLREETTKGNDLAKQRQKSAQPDAAYGYGGKFGVEKDRMDRSAVGHDYVAKLNKHESQTDYSTGFGGKFGVQTDRVDKSALNWSHKETVEKHASQKDYSSGFGGKFGVEHDRQDKSAVGWDHIEKPHKHDSQNVGKRENIITEQTQKPSLLKAKFESLAKLGDDPVKPLQKPKAIAKRWPPAITNEEAPQVKQPIKLPKEDPVSVEPALPPSVERLRPALEIEKEVTQIKEPEPPLKIDSTSDMVNAVPAPHAFQNNTELDDDWETERDDEQSPSAKQQDYAEPMKQHEIMDASEVSQSAMNPEEFEKLRREEEQILRDQLAKEANDDDEDDVTYQAIALYDYQAAADDEITFDPEEIITNIEMIDEGWWRGTCRGVTGLFPANYVQLQRQE